MIPGPIPPLLLLILVVLVPGIAVVGTVVVALAVFHARVVIGGRWWPRPVGLGTRIFWVLLAVVDILLLSVFLAGWLVPKSG